MAAKTRRAARNHVSAKTIECASCETTHHSADGIIPAGWATCQGVAWCTDCMRAGIPERELTAKRMKAA